MPVFCRTLEELLELVLCFEAGQRDGKPWPLVTVETKGRPLVLQPTVAAGGYIFSPVPRDELVRFLEDSHPLAWAGPRPLTANPRRGLPFAPPTHQSRRVFSMSKGEAEVDACIHWRVFDLLACMASFNSPEAPAIVHFPEAADPQPFRFGPVTFADLGIKVGRLADDSPLQNIVVSNGDGTYHLTAPLGYVASRKVEGCVLRWILVGYGVQNASRLDHVSCWQDTVEYVPSEEAPEHLCTQCHKVPIGGVTPADVLQYVGQLKYMCYVCSRVYCSAMACPLPWSADEAWLALAEKREPYRGMYDLYDAPVHWPGPGELLVVGPTRSGEMVVLVPGHMCAALPRFLYDNTHSPEPIPNLIVICEKVS